MSDEIPAPAPADAAAKPTPAPAPATAPRKRRALRNVLLMLGPLVVIAGAVYVYFTTGRFIETDNAYVKADVVIVSSQVAGPITRVAVHENQRVTAGDVLFTVDDRAYRVALDRANAQLGAINDYVEGIRASYRARLEELRLQHNDADYETHEYERLSALAARKLTSDVDVDEARHKRDTATLQLRVTEKQIDQIRAQLGGDPERPVTEQSAYLAAKSIHDTAVLDLEHTVVRAPFDGIASKVPQLGQYVAPGAPVMSVVGASDMWIEANYKETELTNVSVGQKVDVKIDTYPNRKWDGTVESISQATGSEFSVIPAQNATGNWVKITQRIPVRIAVHPHDGDPDLRVGMSAVVAIDTEHERPAPAFITWLRGDDAHAAPAHDGT
jgi:membrane fusion protein (multidrug efflux system)